MQDKKKAYHHKDLRNALIEKSIEIVSSEGVQSFSLRKAAAACGVSHAAPYKHFQNKEEFFLSKVSVYAYPILSLVHETVLILCAPSKNLLKINYKYIFF